MKRSVELTIEFHRLCATRFSASWAEPFPFRGFIDADTGVRELFNGTFWVFTAYHFGVEWSSA